MWLTPTWDQFPLCSRSCSQSLLYSFLRISQASGIGFSLHVVDPAKGFPSSWSLLDKVRTLMPRLDKVNKTFVKNIWFGLDCGDKVGVSLTFKHPKWRDGEDKGWKRVSFMNRSDMKGDRLVKECNFSGKGNAVIIPSACHQPTTFPPFCHKRNQREVEKERKRERKKRVTVTV